MLNRFFKLFGADININNDLIGVTIHDETRGITFNDDGTFISEAAQRYCHSVECQNKIHEAFKCCSPTEQCNFMFFFKNTLLNNLVEESDLDKMIINK